MTPTAPDNSVIQAAGGILFRKSRMGEEVMLVHRKRYEDWTLPKGKVKAGESFQEAALREVGEETGCSCQLEQYLGATSYEVDGVPKIVLFWRMSVVQEQPVTDHEEVMEAAWLQVSVAVQRLSYRDERALLLRCAGRHKKYKSPDQLTLTRPQKRWLWFQDKRGYSRLLREFEVFRLELASLESRSPEARWAAEARDHLENVRRCLECKDVESGWFCLHAARRLAVFGLDRAELANRALTLRERSKGISSSWRGVSMQNLLSVSDDQLTPERVADAMALGDEFSSNQYHKIRLMAGGGWHRRARRCATRRDRLARAVGKCAVVFA